MREFIAAFAVLALSVSSRVQYYTEMTAHEVTQESQFCGQSNFQKNNCLEKPNCVFMVWHINKYGDRLRVCLSYNEIMKYYIKDPSEYLRRTGAHNHKTITKSNFCDVIDDSKIFMDLEGSIDECTISTL